jgi:hypothetical protein
MRIASLALVSVLLAGITGCAGQAAAPVTPAAPLARAAPVTPADPLSSAGPDNLVPDGYAGRFRIAATVLENRHHGPQLCVSTTASMPPQCNGLTLSGWRWNGLNPESDGGTTWGSYVITGTFDGRVFTLSEPATVNDGSVKPPPRAPEPDYTSPCPAPAGGWRPVNLAKATDAAFQAASIMVSADADFAGLWLDQQTMPTVDPNRGGVIMNDPTKLVLNVRFTKDLARHEADIRKVWGGALCVSQAEHSLAELKRVEKQVNPGPGVIYSEIDPVTGIVEVEMWVATHQRQRELDVKYGSRLVHLAGALAPID